MFIFRLLLFVGGIWGQHFAGITDSIPLADTKVLYLTLDACGGKHGSNCDKTLIDLLIAYRIPATLFVNSRWIDANMETIRTLADEPFFRFENHGVKHRPASVSGLWAYNIKGTTSADELIAEIVPNNSKIERLTGRRPVWYRSGTAYYDATAVRIITEQLGMKIAGFAIAVDAGATLSAKQVYRNMMRAKSGDILLAHVNQPASGTCAGIAKAIPELLKKGFVFRPLP
jgi:peptidoglycan/xylan/chitin deacetylase (PgdA/CDA1 family)